VVVTVGASQVLYTIFQSFCEVGDEVVMFSPVFDIYVPQVVMSGATPVYSPLVLRGGAWEVDWENLERCVTERTRVLVVNTPHNPTGKVFSQADLERIAAIARRFPRLLVVSDEVYEHMLFDNLAHKNLASILFDQTITVSSSGKTFSVTGWKVGWAIAPKEICVGLATTQQWTSFSISTPHQEAVSRALALAKQPYESHPDYYSWLTAMYSTKRDHLLTTLRRAGLKPITPQGSFFILADIADVQIPATYTDAGQPRDYAFCRWLTKEVGVTAIPCSAFFPEGQKHLGANLARFAFCKKDESLEEARVRLFKAFGDNEKN
jgi:aspartate/methionine/tyrosine aminotransferase